MMYLMLLLTALLTFQGDAVARCDPNDMLTIPHPDGSYTVTIACEDDRYTLTRVDTETGVSVPLGEIADTRRGVTGDGITAVVVDRWLDDGRVLALRASTGAATYNWRYVFTVIPTQPNSVTMIAADYVARPRFSDNPERYEWVTEDGITETYTVYRYDVTTNKLMPLLKGDCLLRDDLENELSCHMLTAHTNASYTDDDEATRLLLNIGDSAREVKTIEVRNLPDGNLLYTIDALGMGYAEWISADTAAVFNLRFDFATAGFAGVFLQFGEDGKIINEEPFSLPNGEPLTQRPSWMEDTTP